MIAESLLNLLTPRAKSWLQRLEAREEFPPLAPTGVWDVSLTHEILESTPKDIFLSPPAVRDAHELISCGLLLWNDDLNESHEYSQKLKSASGSCWHGIMHRREPDFGNAKYWFHRVGDHPAFGPLREKVILLLQQQGDGYSQSFLSRLQVGRWDPFEFVDRCENAACRREPPEVVELLESIQLMEIRNLLNWEARSWT